MATKRKAAVPPEHTERGAKRLRITKTQVRFAWEPRDWVSKSKITSNVVVMASKTNRKQLVVMKVLQLLKSSSDPRPYEIRALSLLHGTCNRVVKPLFYAPSQPDAEHSTVIFEHYPLGDLAVWKEKNFDKKNFKPVPESFIWRFFLQMSQALAWIQNQIGPSRDERECILHRDIKPKNILVVDNGTTYPSFKLTDFGCAMEYDQQKMKETSLCGTYEWQPPENPKICTMAAEIWAVGACVHFLAIGQAPIASVALYTVDRLKGGKHHPRSAQNYRPPQRYYAARVPRRATPINLSQEEQVAQGIAPYICPDRADFNEEYSDELNYWMMQCLRRTPSRRPWALRLMNGIDPVARQMLKKLGGKAALSDLEVVCEGPA